MKASEVRLFDAFKPLPAEAAVLLAELRASLADEKVALTKRKTSIVKTEVAAKSPGAPQSPHPIERSTS